MKKFTTFFATLCMGMVFSSTAMAQLAYNEPFSASDWDWDDDKTTIVGSVGQNSWSDDHGIRLGNNVSGGFDYNDKYVVIALSAKGNPNQLTANTVTRDAAGFNTGATNVYFSVSESADNQTFTEVWSSKTKKNDITITLQPETRYVKILYSGNFSGCYKDLTISGTYVETGVENVVDATHHMYKVMKNGQIFIMKDNQLYDCMGRMVE